MDYKEAILNKIYIKKPRLEIDALDLDENSVSTILEEVGIALPEGNFDSFLVYISKKNILYLYIFQLELSSH